jgi:hypothetical protein
MKNEKNQLLWLVLQNACSDVRKRPLTSCDKLNNIEGVGPKKPLILGPVMYFPIYIRIAENMKTMPDRP